MLKQKQITECPECGNSSIFVDMDKGAAVVIILKTRRVIVPKKVKAVCNRSICKQLFWYYPNTGKVTRRLK